MYHREYKPKKICKYLEKEQIEKMLTRAREDNKRNYLILLTFWKTGMRCNELTNLRKRDIKSDEITIRQGKGSKDRLVPIDSALADLLNFHSTGQNLDDKLFPLTNAHVRNIVHKYQGEESIHPHTMRHSFAVYCLKNGMNIRVLQKILGHTDLTTTAIYLDIVGKDIKEDYKKIQW